MPNLIPNKALRNDSSSSASTANSSNSGGTISRASTPDSYSLINFLKSPAEYLSSNEDSKMYLLQKLQQNNNKKYKHLLAVVMLLRNFTQKELHVAEYHVLNICPVLKTICDRDDIWSLSKYDIDVIGILTSNAQWLANRYSWLNEKDKFDKRCPLLRRVIRLHVFHLWNLVLNLKTEVRKKEETNILVDFFINKIPSLVKLVSNREEYDKFMLAHQSVKKEVFKIGNWEPSIKDVNNMIKEFVNPWSKKNLCLSEHEYKLLKEFMQSGVEQNGSWKATFEGLMLLQRQSLWDSVTSTFLWYMGCSTNSFIDRVIEMLSSIKHNACILGEGTSRAQSGAQSADNGIEIRRYRVGAY